MYGIESIKGRCLVPASLLIFVFQSLSPVVFPGFHYKRRKSTPSYIWHRILHLVYWVHCNWGNVLISWHLFPFGLLLLFHIPLVCYHLIRCQNSANILDAFETWVTSRHDAYGH